MKRTLFLNLLPSVVLPFILSFATILGFAPALLASVSLKTDSAKRLQIPISKDSMNRIAFANDRIAQVFGDEDAYTLQSDETRGQIFLKPTELNGEKPISITVTTEQNLVQDMELLPQQIPTSTIILKGDGKSETRSESSKPESSKSEGSKINGRFSGFGLPGQGSFSPGILPQQMSFALDRSAQLIRLIIEAARQPLSDIELESDSDSTIEKPPLITLPNLKIEGILIKRESSGSMSLYRLTNTTETDLELSESAFAESQVLAISLESLLLKPKESTRLFVIRSV